MKDKIKLYLEDKLYSNGSNWFESYVHPTYKTKVYGKQGNDFIRDQIAKGKTEKQAYGALHKKDWKKNKTPKEKAWRNADGDFLYEGTSKSKAEKSVKKWKKRRDKAVDRGTNKKLDLMNSKFKGVAPGATAVGAVGGGVAGYQGSKLLTKKLRAKIAYLKSKKDLNAKDQATLRSSTMKLRAIAGVSTAVGAIGGGFLANKLAKKAVSKAKNHIYNKKKYNQSNHDGDWATTTAGFREKPKK